MMSEISFKILRKKIRKGERRKVGRKEEGREGENLSKSKKR